MTGQLIKIEEIYPAGRGWLEDRARNETSQFGEDGLIDAALEWYGAENEHCFECGAADGDFYSNTKRLRDKNWKAVLIESNEDAFRKLLRHESPRVHCVHRHVECGALDLILREHEWPMSPDLGIIDVDGQDYWLWHFLSWHRPRLLLVEIHPYRNGDSPPMIADPPAPAIGSAGQAGKTAILELGTRKRYVPLARTYCNILFVSEEARGDH